MRRSAPTGVALQLHPLRAEFSSGTLPADARSSELKSSAGCLNSVQSERRPLGGEFDCGTARLWNAATGAEVATIQTSGRQVVFSPDGDLVLAATSDNAARLVKTDGTELRVLSGHDSRITGAAFSPDGQLVATASLDRTARIWSVKDGSTVAILKGHGDEPTESRSARTVSRC